MTGRPQVHFINESRVLAALKDPFTTRNGKIIIGHTATKHSLNPAEERLLKDLVNERQLPVRSRLGDAEQLPFTGKKLKRGCSIVGALKCTASNRALVFHTSDAYRYTKLLSYYVRNPAVKSTSNFLYHIPEFREDAEKHGFSSFVVEVLEVQDGKVKYHPLPESQARLEATRRWEEKLIKRGLGLYRRDRQKYRSYERSPDPVVARLGEAHAKARAAWENFKGTEYQTRLANLRLARAQTDDAVRKRAISSEEARKLQAAISIKWRELQLERDKLQDEFRESQQALVKAVRQSLGEE